MARRSDPARIESARREATTARLISAGYAASVAAELVAEWEASRHGSATRADWERFDEWLTNRGRPPPRAPPQFPQGATFRQLSTVSLTVCVPVAP